MAVADLTYMTRYFLDVLDRHELLVDTKGVKLPSTSVVRRRLL